MRRANRLLLGGIFRKPVSNRRDRARAFGCRRAVRKKSQSHWPNCHCDQHSASTALSTILSAPKTYTMATKHASRALRASLRQAAAPRVQQRTFVSAVNAASRPMVQKVALASFVQPSRGAKTVDFAGDKEKVYGEAIPLPRGGHRKADGFGRA